MTDRDTFAAAALTGLLVHANDSIDEETLDTPSDIAYTAYQMADAMLRERDRTNHTPVTEPMAKEKRAEVFAEPDAWLVIGDDPSCEYQYVTLFRESAAAAAAEENGTVVPLYRHQQPTLTGAEREAVERAAIAYELLPTAGAQQVSATLRGLLERMA